MKMLLNLAAAIFIFIGLGCAANAVLIPGRVALSEAPAVQVIQVYTQAVYFTLLAIAALLFARLMQAAATGAA